MNPFVRRALNQSLERDIETPQVEYLIKLEDSKKYTPLCKGILLARILPFLPICVMVITIASY
jgi:hypothetical protein